MEELKVGERITLEVVCQMCHKVYDIALAIDNKK